MVGHGGILSTISARFSGTGRSVQADAIFGEVDAWSRLVDLRSSVVFSRVQEALRLRPTLSEAFLTCFRGRGQPAAVNAPFLNEEMGPPPAHDARRNRYNEDGAPALYLCTTRAAVGRELAGSAKIWVQQFQVPVGRLRIADLRSPEAESDQLLSAVMWCAEMAGAEGHPTQRFSQFLGSVVAEHFNGMLVSGVRGDESLRYSNLVIFQVGEAWRGWLAPESPSPL